MEKLGVTLWKEKKGFQNGSDEESTNALKGKHQLIEDETMEESDEDEMLMKKRVLPPVAADELELVKPVRYDTIIITSCTTRPRMVKTSPPLPFVHMAACVCA